MDLEENWSQIRDARIKYGMLDYVYHKQIYEDKYSNMRYDIHLQGIIPNIMDDIKPKTKEMQGNYSHISPSWYSGEELWHNQPAQVKHLQYGRAQGKSVEDQDVEWELTNLAGSNQYW